MWKSTYRYSQELEMAEFGAPLEESTTGGWFGFKSRQFKIDEYGNLEMDEMKTAEAGPEELDPFAEEFEMGGDSFVQDSDPQRVQPGMLAAEALYIMETRKITALIVVDDNDHPVGVVHLHDILRAGVA